MASSERKPFVERLLTPLQEPQRRDGVRYSAERSLTLTADGQPHVEMGAADETRTDTRAMADPDDRDRASREPLATQTTVRRDPGGTEPALAGLWTETAVKRDPGDPSQLAALGTDTRARRDLQEQDARPRRRAVARMAPHP